MQQITGVDDVLVDKKANLIDLEESIADEKKNVDAAAAMSVELQVVSQKFKGDVVAAEEKKL